MTEAGNNAGEGEQPDPRVMAQVAKLRARVHETFGKVALAGVVIWASVSEEVDAKIREQIKAGVFPVRLAAGDWASGEINWLLDVIAPSTAMATSVLANMKQVVKGGDLRIHPVVTRLVEKGALEKLGASWSEGENE